jgi:GDPmannose 4,6-dehydratase
MSKTALIIGVSGQDGAYLSKLLLDKGYTVIGTSRDAELKSFSGLQSLGIQNKIELETLVPNDFRSMMQVISNHKPDEIYFLSGQSSVGLSFRLPFETMESIVVSLQNLLEVVRMISLDCKIYNACSSECFGDAGKDTVNETTSFKPLSPYAVAKCTSFWQVSTYRKAYNMFACSGILFNHESPLRHQRFVTQKIISFVKNAKKSNSKEKLYLGNLDIIRDWGWAPEYVEAMYLMLQQDKPSDFIIATGKSYSLKEFVRYSFEKNGMNWEDYVVQDEQFLRPSELNYIYSDPSKASRELGWKAKTDMYGVIDKMFEI